MPGRSLCVARIAGIPVRVSAWWLVVLVLLVWSLGGAYFPGRAPGIGVVPAYGLAVVSALLLCVSIVAHEYGHALVARHRGIAVEEIDLWLLGGVATLRSDPREPRDELSYAIAGPAVSVVLAAACAALALLARSASPALRALVDYQLLVNASILGFNLLPAFPLDGGRVLRAALWRRGQSFDRATEISASVGRDLGYLIAVLGGGEVALGVTTGLWLVVIGVFLIASGGAEAAHARLHAAAARLQAATIMSAPVIAIPDRLTVQQAAESFFLPYRHTSFAVIDGAAVLLGIVTIARAEAVPVGERTTTYVGEITERDPQVIVAEDCDIGELLDRPAFARIGRAVVVDREGSPIGLVSVTDVQHSIRALRLARPATSRRTGRRLRARLHSPRRRSTHSH